MINISTIFHNNILNIAITRRSIKTTLIIIETEISKNIRISKELIQI
jgi:hypothetical protein